LSYTIIIILGLLIIVPILIAYYYDYRANPKEFSLSIKTLGKGFLKVLIYVSIYFGINKTYEWIIPFNKNHGMEFNSKRKEFGIPTLKSNWEINHYQSEQFITYWWKPEPHNGHFKKVIEYDIFNCKFETDFYHNKKLEGTFAWSKYDYNENSFTYGIESPNIERIITEIDGWKVEPITILDIVTKKEFDHYIEK